MSFFKICHGASVQTVTEEAKQARESMIHEAQLMSYYVHRHVIQLYGVACDHYPVMIVMEYCPGGNLQEHMQKYKQKVSTPERIVLSYELLYEVFNDGEKPWPDDEPKRIATHIRHVKFCSRGKMPDLPPQTPDGMKSLVTKIWNLNPEARPTMDDLTRHLRTLHRGEFKNDESDSHCSLKSGYDDDLEPPSRGGPPTSKKSRRERGIPSKSK
ncbi:hypothetical protein ANCCEY_05213 [Ancylostoma ceylanicum]|uniref:Serine-threonine/tyrosine-protein kinase catalytic domain-containing protein n=1 Tax=Ancylostoma ceylanicum TaxID=53326 RepID=A0A0D6M041_9BILA|nr:hypothetical protein ANCCEY_05213 [Ancylostoma ceylanicum]